MRLRQLYNITMYRINLYRYKKQNIGIKKLFVSNTVRTGDLVCRQEKRKKRKKRKKKKKRKKRIARFMKMTGQSPCSQAVTK